MDKQDDSPVQDTLPFLLGRMESKIDTLIDSHKSLTGSIDEHDTRIRDLEQSRGWFLGLMAAVGGGVSFLVSWLTANNK